MTHSFNPIKDACTYMEKYFSDEITLDMLAESAGMTPSYFSKKFKEQLGVSPIQYLLEIRMKVARDLLKEQEQNVKQISQEIGFQDEFYFSRKFKSYYGVSPRLYRKKMVRETKPMKNSILSISSDKRIVVTLQRLADPLIALGINPTAIGCFGTTIENTYLHSHISPLTKDLGEYPPQREAIESTTDVIIADQWRTGEEYREYAEISPTVIISGKDWRDYLQRIAQLFGMEHQGAELLREYEQKVQYAKQKLRQSINEKQVIMLRVLKHELQIYNPSPYGVGGVLYNDLGLKPPEPINSAGTMRTISLSELAILNPDYIFVEIVPWLNGSSEYFQEFIKDSTEWSKINAVRNEKVAFVENNLWVEGDGIIGRTMMVEEILRILSPL
ncbi:AraC family transcriptional regulator [Sutcliffiella horikoshii]|uniref:AraC family transcriptional regulator n=1 Tax=Sutcliffiella horikoshii TaxID=79883 RepID=A0AA94WMD0_9BACI|nr:AraC family transcriptional regulator [Sutcliffiella horikoshii]TYS54448.1 AraC family transcriptional regulator [Sutcliffiella horikoshii]